MDAKEWLAEYKRWSKGREELYEIEAEEGYVSSTCWQDSDDAAFVLAHAAADLLRQARKDGAA